MLPYTSIVEERIIEGWIYKFNFRFFDPFSLDLNSFTKSKKNAQYIFIDIVEICKSNYICFKMVMSKNTALLNFVEWIGNNMS